MREIIVIKFIYSMLIILCVASFFGQSTLKAIKFMNCEWGISLEEAITSLGKEMPDIDFKENMQLWYGDKKIGMREFETENFLFANYKWQLKMGFLDNKLARVILISSKADNLKVIEELEAKFGKYREVPITGYEVWKAIDGSQLTLMEIPGKKKAISVLYHAPGFWEEYQKKKR